MLPLETLILIVSIIMVETISKKDFGVLILIYFIYILNCYCLLILLSTNFSAFSRFLKCFRNTINLLIPLLSMILAATKSTLLPHL